jgi:hypothetical protein
MDPNPYESPLTKQSAGKGRLRLMTVAVIALLILLAAACVGLGFLAYLIQRLA